MTALSNMPEASTLTHADGTKTVSFLESPRMSTYLLAFVVGEFDHVAMRTEHGTCRADSSPRLFVVALRKTSARVSLVDRSAPPSAERTVYSML